MLNFVLRLRAALSILILSLLIIPLVSGHATTPTAVARPEHPVPVGFKIAHVEHGLLPAVILTGKPAPRRALISEMKRLNVPAVSIAVLHGGMIEWSKGYGVTSIHGRAVTPDTLFQAASISKTVTALAALRLVQEHRLTLDDDVNGQLKGWQLPTPPGEHVTLRELLSHTAGTTVHGFEGYAAGQTLPSVEDVLLGRAPANSKPVTVDVAPGTVWRYSGGGYVVVQKLISDVTGKPFAEVMNNEVLRPSGMTHSSFSQPLDAASLANAAMPYDETGKPVAGGPHTYPELAAAGLWTTPSDLLRYAIAVRDSARGKARALLDQTLATQMLTPGKGNYGLGLAIHGTAATRDFSHAGANEGYESFFLAYTNSGDGVAVMTNGDQGNELAMEVTRGVAAVYRWPSNLSVERKNVPISAASSARLIGNYTAPGFGLISVSRKGSGLILTIKGWLSEPLYADTAGAFFILSNDIILRINIGELDPVGHIISGSFDAPLTKIGDSKP